MALSIKNDEADRLARALAAETGESLTTAVVTALRERLDRERGRGTSVEARLSRLQVEVAAMRRLDARSDDELLGHDEHGLPG